MKKMNAKLNVLIAILIVMSLLAGFALADEKLYTSESFRIPLDRVVMEEEVPEEAGTEEAALPEEETSGEEVKPSEEAAPSQDSENVTPEEETVNPEAETAVPGENGNASEEAALPEDAEGTEGEEQEPEQPEILPAEERKVYITSSRGEHVTQGEPIYLEAHLEGFGNLPVTYHWQVDKNDGAGWQDTGSNRNYHVFMASAETVQYNWRLIVNVDE